MSAKRCKEHNITSDNPSRVRSKKMASAWEEVVEVPIEVGVLKPEQRQRFLKLYQARNELWNGGWDPRRRVHKKTLYRLEKKKKNIKEKTSFPLFLAAERQDRRKSLNHWTDNISSDQWYESRREDSDDMDDQKAKFQVYTRPN